MYICLSIRKTSSYKLTIRFIIKFAKKIALKLIRKFSKLENTNALSKSRDNGKHA